MKYSVPGSPRAAILAFAGALLGFTGLVLLLSDGGILLTRPFWVDEVLTAMVAGRASPVAVIADLGSGADGGASLFHLGMWLLDKVTGGLTPVVVRAASLVCVMLALVLVFAVLRRRLTGTAATAGGLAVGANALVIEHSYEGRFYGPWLLCLAILAFVLSRRQHAASRRNAVALGIAAIAVTTIHFYGVITLAIMVVAVVASHGSRWRASLEVVKPAAAGLLALPVVAALALAQRRAYSVPSWLPDFSIGQLTGILGDFWLATVPFLGAVIIVLSVVVLRRRGNDAPLERARAPFGDAGIVALAGLAAMPLALALLSVVGQPSMLPRYAIGASLAWGPWMALAAALAGRWVARAIIVVTAWYWFAGYSKEASLKQQFANAVSGTADAYRRARASAGPMPIVFTSIHVMYPLALDPGVADRRAMFLDIPDSTFARLFPDSTRLGQANRVAVLERDLARVHRARFGVPALAPLEELSALPRFLLLAPEGRLPEGFPGIDRYARTMFPRHHFRRLLADLSLLELEQVGPSSK